MENQKIRFHILYIFIAFWGVLIIRDLWVTRSQVEQIPYSEFENLLKGNKISDLVISDNHIRGSLREPATNQKKQFITSRVEPDLAKELEPYNVKYTRVVENTFMRDLLSWVLPTLFFIGIWLFIMRRMTSSRGGLMSIGKSKAKIFAVTDTKTLFQDVAGVDEAKEELKEVVGFLKSPKDYGRLGARIPKGVLLVGPPGTGKTMLAKAVAGEAGVPFFSISGSEFVEMIVGVGAARVRDLFEQARKSAPCIVFIDELDALGRSRTTHPMSAGHDEKEQTLNQLLVEMDGFDTKAGIIVLGATNRPEILDPALLRAGRFDRQVVVDRPDKTGRMAILKVHMRSIQTTPNLDLEEIAAMTPGFTGADLANLVNEAALMATRRNASAVALADFTSAIERVLAGLEMKNRLMNPLEKRIVAYHEMGHALVAAALPGCDPVHKISIIPRSVGALGYTIQRPTEDRYLMTRTELENKMAVLLGGRASEKVIFDHLSTGAADDISKATDIARNMVMRFGMEERLGNVTYDSDPRSFLHDSLSALESRKFSEATAREIDVAVKELVDRALRRALHILRANHTVLEDGAQQLLRQETLTGQELVRLFDRLKQPEAAVTGLAGSMAVPSN